MVSRGPAITATITGDERDLIRALARSGRELGDFERQASGASSRIASSFTGVGVGITAVAAAMVAAGLTAKGLAEDAAKLETAQNRVTAVYGESAGVIEEFSDRAASAVGLSKRAALDATGAFGAMFTQLQINEADAAKMSVTLTTLAADLASFAGVPVADALESLQAGFRGEYDSLQRLIPTVSAARIEQEALERGYAANAKELTATQKALAFYNVALEDSGRAAGNYARTADRLPAQQAEFAARLENVKGIIGTALLPVMNDLLVVTNNWVELHGEEAAYAFADGLTVASEKGREYLDTLDDIARLTGNVIGSVQDMLEIFAAPIGPFRLATDSGAIRPDVSRFGGGEGEEVSSAVSGTFRRVRSPSGGYYTTPRGTAVASPQAQQAQKEAEAMQVAAGDVARALSPLNDTLPVLTSNVDTLTASAQALIAATEAAARAEADLLKQRQQAGIGYINGLNSQGVQKYAPGVFETIAGAYGLNSNFTTYSVDGGPTLDVAIP